MKSPEKKISSVLKKVDKHKKVFEYWLREFHLLNKSCPHYNDMICKHPIMEENKKSTSETGKVPSLCIPTFCPLRARP